MFSIENIDIRNPLGIYGAGIRGFHISLPLVHNVSGS